MLRGKRIGLWVTAALVAAMGAGAVEARPAKAKKSEPATSEADKARKEAEDRYKQPKTFPTKITWMLKSLNGKPVPAGYDMTFMLDENYRASGFGGCNYWSSTIYPQAGQRIASGPPALTRKQCDKDVMAMERAYLTAVHSGPDWDLEGPELVMKGKGGSLRFDRAL
jgi:heat shock protein HslJ